MYIWAVLLDLKVVSLKVEFVRFVINDLIIDAEFQSKYT